MQMEKEMNRIIVTKQQLEKDKHFKFCITDKESNELLETYHMWWEDE